MPPFRKKSILVPWCAYLAIAGLFVTSNHSSRGSDIPTPAPKILLPANFDVLLKDDRAYITDPSGTPHQTTIDPDLQLRLQSFIAERGSPIASAVVSDIATGRILALVQGRSPDRWGSATHTSLHNKFPAASLFKTVVTAAAMEITPTGNDQNFGLPGGCGGQDILPKGDWMNDDRGGGMTLRRAFGHSCNSFFAKLAINQLGLGTITHFAKVFGWEQQLPTDFVLEPSKMLPPGAANSTTHTVGRFAAGFGHVGISPVHANWIAATIGNRGLPRPLILFTDSDVNLITPIEQSPLVSAETTSRLLDVMKSTVNDGTASTAFGRGRYRSVAQETGGKTGTLNGRSPRGLTTLFYGVYPLSKPQIAVSAIVVLEDHFAFKASQLAAEAIVDWRDLQDQRNGIIRSAILEEKYMPRIHKRSKARHSRRR